MFNKLFLSLFMGILFLRVSNFCAPSGYAGVQVPTQSTTRSGGMRLFPLLFKWKGFDRAKGIQFSLEDPNGSKSPGGSQSALNLTYAQPSLRGLNDMSVTHYGFEYENRSYDSGLSFSSAAVGVQRLSPNLGLSQFFENKGEFARSLYKPYISFRMGYRLLQNVPLLGNSGVLQVSYTLSDDYRFPSEGPHGYQKVPLKGFRFDVGFRF